MAKKKRRPARREEHHHHYHWHLEGLTPLLIGLAGLALSWVAAHGWAQ